MKNTVLAFWVILAFAAFGSYGGWVLYRHAQADDDGGSKVVAARNTLAEDEATRMRHEIAAGGPSVPTFKLTDQDGHEFDTAGLKGNVWVASYFFTSCPGPCYKLNQALASLQADEKLKAVKFVSVTCDPETDTPEILKQYAARFDADLKRWTFVTGEQKQIEKVGMDIFVVPVASRTHSDLAIALDRESRIRGYFHLTDNGEVEKLGKRLAVLLAEKDAPSGGEKK